MFFRKITPGWCAVAAALVFMPCLATGQAPVSPEAHAVSTPPADDAGLGKLASKVLPLNANVTVAGQVSVEAVLIPASLAKRIFGKEVSDNYAAVELVVSNKDSKAALIVQSVFLDYSQWLLSGVSPVTPEPALDDTQKANKPWQVASVGARLIRGQMLDAQQWTKRNWTIRILTAIGSIAGGFQFPFTADVAKGIAAFNGEVVPGISVLWPDGSTNQINRITDFGFETNKIIPKEASDIIIAFFPIDRFLTPGFHHMFVTDPAGFFMPGELLADAKTSRELTKFVLPIARAIDPTIVPDDPKDTTPNSNGLLQRLGAVMATDCPDEKHDDTNCRLQKMFARLSLNSVRVVVGGVMSVDAAAVPPTIYSVDFADGNDNADVWKVKGKARSGTMSGLYLTGGTPDVVDAKGKSIGAKMQVDTGKSTDTSLSFTMTLDACVPPAASVSFVVTKPVKAAQTTGGSEGSGKSVQQVTNSIRSMPYLFNLPVYTCPANASGAADEGAAGAENKKKESGSSSH